MIDNDAHCDKVQKLKTLYRLVKSTLIWSVAHAWKARGDQELGSDILNEDGLYPRAHPIRGHSPGLGHA